jgi:hypothetical protein
MRLRPRVIFVLAVCFAVSGGAAWADGVPVENASFETTNAFTSSCRTAPRWERSLGQTVPEHKVTRVSFPCKRPSKQNPF